MKEALLEPLLQRFRMRKVILHIPREANILDIGCGNGLFLRSIQPFIARGVGIDMKHLPETQGKLEFMKSLLDTTLEFPDAAFDVVTMLAVLEHLVRPEGITKEVFRVLKPGGKLLLTTPSPAAKPILEFLAFKAGVVSREEIEDHKNYFWGNDVSSMLERAGFQKKDIQTRYFQFGFNNFVVAKKC